MYQGCRKRLYVSPFVSASGHYSFHVDPPGRAATIGVALRDRQGPLLKTHFSGRRCELTDGALLRVLTRHPLMTLKVIGAIHYEALKLWLKGLKTTFRPQAVRYAVTLVGADEREPCHGRP